jgi:threonylcarbamoyladenosine tRNA methylthiotransferase MtaB
MVTASITNLGCKVNQSEMEAAARLLRERGVRLVDPSIPADVHLVNTCTVTATADQKSRQAVRRARRANPDAQIVVTGCSVQVDPAAFELADPAARLIDNRSKDQLLDELDVILGLPPLDAVAGGRTAPQQTVPLPTLSGVEVEGIHDDRTSVERTRAFVKVQDGCSFYCTYCIIPTARGPERSLAPDAVLADVRRAVAAGHREIVLTGINIGTYDGGWSERGPRGSHLRSALTLGGLIRRILDETSTERLRLSSIEPQHVDDDLLDTWRGCAGRCLPHFHLPLQSGDDGVLRRMGRRYDTRFYTDLVGRLRAAIPDLAIHGDVIVGFPTENEDAWRRSLAFIEAIGFAGIHVFRYSARPRTPALRMTGQVDERTRKARATELLAMAATARARFAREHIGREASVLFESRLADGRWIGHAEDHTLVSALPGDEQRMENAIGRVTITGTDPHAPDRAIGRLIQLDPPTRSLRTALPVLSSITPGGTDGP